MFETAMMDGIGYAGTPALFNDRTYFPVSFKVMFNTLRDDLRKKKYWNTDTQLSSRELKNLADFETDEFCHTTAKAIKMYVQKLMEKIDASNNP